MFAGQCWRQLSDFLQRARTGRVTAGQLQYCRVTDDPLPWFVGVDSPCFAPTCQLSGAGLLHRRQKGDAFDLLPGILRNRLVETYIAQRETVLDGPGVTSLLLQAGMQNVEQLWQVDDIFCGILKLLLCQWAARPVGARFCFAYLDAE